MDTQISPERKQAFLRDIEPIMKLKTDTYCKHGVPTILRGKDGEVVYGSVEFAQNIQEHLAMCDRMVARVATLHGIPWVDPD